MADMNSSDGREEDTRVVRLATGAFGHVEHAVYIALGILLSAAALLALGSVVAQLYRGMQDWTSGDAILLIIDRLLFVLLLVEILHTVRASIRTGGLTPEPFLIVGLIASIRRVLVLTLQTAEATKPGGYTAENAAIVQSAMLELSVIGALILILVISLFLLGRTSERTLNKM